MRQIMLIGRDRLSEQSQTGIAIADGQVAQNLIVSPVFLEDEDHVLDALTYGRHHFFVVVGLDIGEPVVGGHLLGQSGELRHVGRGKVWRPAFTNWGL